MMRTIDRLKLRVRSLWRRNQVEREMHAELRFHVEELTRENVSAGMSQPDARQAALRTVGGVAQWEEQIRDARGVNFFETADGDFRYAVRALRKAPVFAAVAILSLALGTGANMAIFSLIDSVLLQRLPVPNPEQLVFVRTSRVKIGNIAISRTLSSSTVNHLATATQIQGLASVREMDRVNVAVGGTAEVGSAEFVSSNYYSVLGVEAALGRNLGAGDDRASVNGWPAMISYGYWRRRFGGKADVLGEKITVNTVPFTVVGVMPPRFRGLMIDQSADLAMPLAVVPQVEDGKASAKTIGPDDYTGTTFARLKQDATT